MPLPRPIRWLRFQDLETRRERTRAERKDLVKQLEDLTARSAGFEEEGKALGARTDDLLRRSVDVHQEVTAYEGDAVPAAPLQEITTELEELQRIARDFTTQADAIKAASAQLVEDWTRVSAEMDAIEVARRRRLSRLYAGTLALQLGTIALLLLLLPDWNGAHSIHLDYYTAVAALAPILLITGLAELALLGPPIGVAVLTFAVPAIGAEAASLVVLASHASNSSTFMLTLWGLAGTLVSLLGFFITHVRFPPTPR